MARTTSKSRSSRLSLNSSRRPLVLLGGSRWTEEATRNMISWSGELALPVATSFRRASLFPSNHPNYAGDVEIGPNPKLADRVRNADLLVMVGARLSEMPSSSYSLVKIPMPSQKLVHVFPAAEEDLDAFTNPTLAIQATPGPFAEAVTGVPNTTSPTSLRRGAEAPEEYLQWLKSPPDLPGSFQYGKVMVWLGNIFLLMRSSATEPAISPSDSSLLPLP